MKLQKSILITILAGFSFLTMIGCDDGGGGSSSNNPNDYYWDQASNQCRSRKDHSWVEMSKCNGTNGYYNNNGYRLVGNVCYDQYGNIAPSQSYCGSNTGTIGGLAYFDGMNCRYSNGQIAPSYECQMTGFNPGYYNTGYTGGAYMYGSVQMDPTAALIGAAAAGLLMWAL